MKITCFVLCVFGLAALATADSGFFVPKSFYKLDNEGHKSDVVQINPHQANILRRLRRQSSFSGSSSSTSTSGSDGGPVHFQSHQVVQGTPDLASRFGGFDSDSGTGSRSGIHGHAVHTTGVIKDGRVISKTSRTKLQGIKSSRSFI